MPYRRTPHIHARLAAARERILRAALARVAEGGYASASVDAIAARAGVATGTVYRHFHSKAALFAEVFDRASQREIDAVAQATGDPRRPAGDRIADAVATFARRALRGRRLAYALLAEPVDPAVETERLAFRRAYRDLFAAIVRHGIERGEIPAQDADVTAAGLVGATGEALVGPLSRSPAAVDPEKLVSSIVSFCVRSLSPEGSGEPRRGAPVNKEGAHVRA